MANRIQTAAAREQNTQENSILGEMLIKHTIALTKLMQELQKISIIFMEAFSYVSQKDYKNDPKVIIGEMKKIYKHSGAKRWSAESSGLCCLEGKTNLPTIQDPSEFLKSILLQNTPAAKHFRRNILKYSSAFQMTSFGTDMTDFGFLTTYKIQGQCYHLMADHYQKNHINLY